MTNPLRVLLLRQSESIAQLLSEQLRRGEQVPTIRCVDSVSDVQQCLREGEWDIILSRAGVREFAAAAAEHRRSDAATVRMSEQMHALSLRLLEVQEDERRFLARELHDEIGQVLTGLKLVLDMAVTRLPPPQRTSLGEAQRLVEELLTRVRELSLDLRPQALDYLGLLAALEGHLKRYETQTGVSVHFEKPDLARRLAPDVETALYRIIQEALTNVARHAGVKDVSVTLTVEEPLVALVVADLGCGFDTTASSGSTTSSGLSGMRERVAVLSGIFDVESAPGRGTQLKAWLPLRWAEEK